MARAISGYRFDEGKGNGQSGSDEILELWGVDAAEVFFELAVERTAKF